MCYVMFPLQNNLLHVSLKVLQNLNVSSSSSSLRISQDGGVSRVLRPASAPRGLRPTAPPLQRWHRWADPGGCWHDVVGGSVKKKKRTHTHCHMGVGGGDVTPYSVVCSGPAASCGSGVGVKCFALFQSLFCHFPLCISFHFLPPGARCYLY